jgi:hypothetical protein
MQALRGAALFVLLLATVAACGGGDGRESGTPAVAASRPAGWSLVAPAALVLRLRRARRLCLRRRRHGRQLRSPPRRLRPLRHRARPRDGAALGGDIYVAGGTTPAGGGRTTLGVAVAGTVAATSTRSARRSSAACSPRPPVLRLAVQRWTSPGTSVMTATSSVLIMNTSYRWLQQSGEQDSRVRAQRVGDADETDGRDLHAQCQPVPLDAWIWVAEWLQTGFPGVSRRARAARFPCKSLVDRRGVEPLTSAMHRAARSRPALK